MVVVLDPHIQLGLRVGDRVEHFAVHELDAQRLVPPLDLACRGRRTRPSQQVFDAVLTTDPIEQHLTGPRPEAAGEHLSVAVKISAGTPWRRIANANASHVGRAVARSTTNAEMQNLEWSSTPETILASLPSASLTPPTMSICHNSIARDRSHRL